MCSLFSIDEFLPERPKLRGESVLFQDVEGEDADRFKTYLQALFTPGF